MSTFFQLRYAFDGFHLVAVIIIIIIISVTVLRTSHRVIRLSVLKEADGVFCGVKKKKVKKTNVPGETLTDAVPRCYVNIVRY